MFIRCFYSVMVVATIDLDTHFEFVLCLRSNYISAVLSLLFLNFASAAMSSKTGSPSLTAVGDLIILWRFPILIGLKSGFIRIACFNYFILFLKVMSSVKFICETS